MVTVVGIVINIMNTARKSELSVLESTIERLKKELLEDDAQDDLDDKTRHELIDSYELRLKNCSDALSQVLGQVSSMKAGDKTEPIEGGAPNQNGEHKAG